MRDIVSKVSADRPTGQRTKISQYINHFEVPEVGAMKMSYDNDQESVSSQDSGTSSNMSGQSDIPTYRSYQKYLNNYNTLKFKPVKLGKAVDSVETCQPEPEQTSVDGLEGKPRTGSVNIDDVRTHKAEITIQVKPPQQYQERHVPSCIQTVPTTTVPQYSEQLSGDKKFAEQIKVDVNVPLVLEVAAPVAPPPPPPPPPAMPHVFSKKINSQVTTHMLIDHNARLVNNAPRNMNAQRVQPKHDLRTCLLDELKAKHPPKEYQCHEEVDHGTYARRTSEPINTQVGQNSPRFDPAQLNQVNQQNHQQVFQRQVFSIPQFAKPPLPGSPQQPQTPLPSVNHSKQHILTRQNQSLTKSDNQNKFNSLPRRFSEQNKIAAMLSNPEAQTVTRVPAARPDAPVDRDDPSVKKLVYATLRNYVGAYNNRANQLAAQHGHVVQDKGVSEQIKAISASVNLSRLNGRVKETKETE